MKRAPSTDSFVPPAHAQEGDGAIGDGTIDDESGTVRTNTVIPSEWKPPLLDPGSTVRSAQPPTPTRELPARSFPFVLHLWDYIILLTLIIIRITGFALFAAYVYAAFLWMTSLGDSGQIGKAKKIFAEATIGLVVILLSYAIVNTLISNLKT